MIGAGSAKRLLCTSCQLRAYFPFLKPTRRVFTAAALAHMLLRQGCTRFSKSGELFLCGLSMW